MSSVFAVDCVSIEAAEAFGDAVGGFFDDRFHILTDLMDRVADVGADLRHWPAGLVVGLGGTRLEGCELEAVGQRFGGKFCPAAQGGLRLGVLLVRSGLLV